MRDQRAVLGWPQILNPVGREAESFISADDKPLPLMPVVSERLMGTQELERWFLATLPQG